MFMLGNILGALDCGVIVWNLYYALRAAQAKDAATAGNSLLIAIAAGIALLALVL